MVLLEEMSLRKWLPGPNVAYTLVKNQDSSIVAAPDAAIALPTGNIPAAALLVGVPATACGALAGTGSDLAAQAAKNGAPESTVAVLKAQAGSYLDTNIQQLVSPSKRWSFVMQDDGNLVLYKQDASGQVPLWASNTAGKGILPYRLVAQADGNVVAYDGRNTVLWASNTAGKGPGPYLLLMQDDGNCVLYSSDNRPQWATNTNGR